VPSLPARTLRREGCHRRVIVVAPTNLDAHVCTHKFTVASFLVPSILNAMWISSDLASVILLCMSLCSLMHLPLLISPVSDELMMDSWKT
jgi:hypothetical protein